MLWRRKWTRSGHLAAGTRSYRQRGVSAEEHEVYWRGAVWPAWRAHGGRRLPAGASARARLHASHTHSSANHALTQEAMPSPHRRHAPHLGAAQHTAAAARDARGGGGAGAAAERRAIENPRERLTVSVICLD